MMNPKAYLLVGAAMLVSATAASAQTANNPAPAAGNNQPTSGAPTASKGYGGIGDIVVTARKRNEAAQNVPVSITAFNPQILAEKRILNVADVAQNTSGLTLQQSSTTQQFEATIRGQNTLDSTLNLDPAIGLYVDGVYIGPDIGNAVALNFDDAANVEVLKGPQGTLYGRNTSGGAIKVDHILPDYKLGGWFTIGAGNYDQRTIKGAITLPIVDQLATLRLYGRYNYMNGYGHNDYQGVDVQNDRGYDFSAALRLDPAPGLRVVLRGGYDHDESGGPSIHGVYDTDSTTSIENVAIALTNGIPVFQAPIPGEDGKFFQYLTPEGAKQAQALFYAQGPNAGGFYDMNSRFPTPNTLRLYNGSATVDYDVSDGLSIKSISAYRNIKTYRGIDFSGSFAASDIAVQEPLSYHQFTEELTANGHAFDSKLKYTVGGFYMKSKGKDFSSAVTAPIIGSVYPLTSPIPTGLNIENGVEKNKSVAAYGQASYEIIPNLNLTGGVRYTKEHKDLTGENGFLYGTYNPATGFVDPYTPVLVTADNPPVPYGGTGTFVCGEPHQGLGSDCYGKQPYSFSKVTFMASADYKIAPSVLVYAKFGRGFRSGGGQLRLGGFTQVNGQFVPVPPFGPETVDDYEVGIKADFLNHTLRTNVALYNDITTGLQKTVLTVVDGALNSSVQNAAKAKIRGVEFDVTYKPVRQLTLGFSGAYTDPKYKKYIDGGVDVSDQRFQGVAEFVFTASAAYDVDLPFGDLNLNASYWHTSSVALQPGVVGIDGVLGSNPFETQKAYGLLNGRAALSVDNSNLTVALWAKNLLNKKYFTYGLDLTQSLGYANAWGNAPRTFGGEVTFKF
jgi:iron complex outermembrane receptor protein